MESEDKKPCNSPQTTFREEFGQPRVVRSGELFNFTGGLIDATRSLSSRMPQEYYQWFLNDPRLSPFLIYLFFD